MKNKCIRKTAIILLSILLASCLFVVIALTFIKSSSTYIKLDLNKLTGTNKVTLYDNAGKVMDDTIAINNAKTIKLTDLHPYTYNGFVAVEDKRFYKHNGIDIIRILGAIKVNLINNKSLQGASTITQQLIKNTHLNNDKTIKRKINEMLLATELETKLSKNEILENYLNTIYFGRNAYGIENASQTYFNKSAKDLTILESATLIATIKAPSVYAPDKQKCTERAKTVLEIMRKQGVITECELNFALNDKVNVTSNTIANNYGYAYQVQEEAKKLLNVSTQQLISEECEIDTFCDENLQNLAEKYVRMNTMSEIDDYEKNVTIVIADVEGNILANYSTRANEKRQIGSTAKPFAVYAPALEEKIIMECSPVLDEKTNFSGYCPRNYNDKYYGWTTIKEALTKSLNIPAVKTLNSLGIDKAQKYIKHFGIIQKQDLSLALGNVNGGMSVNELISAYTTLANNGIYCKPHYIKAIRNKYGKTIYEYESQKEYVYSPSTAYITTNMLQNVVQNGTANRIAETKINCAGKTGTVGTESGNTDALLVGYTSNLTFLTWIDGRLPNSITGSTLPTEITSQYLTEIYKDNKPKDFEVPNSVIELAIDKDSLRNNQLAVLTNNITPSENYLFDKTNCPIVRANNPYENTTISLNVENDGINIALSKSINDNVKIYRNNEYLTTLSPNTNNYTDTGINANADNNLYYKAEIVRNEKVLYSIPIVNIKTTSNNNDEENLLEDLLGLWYIK